MNIDAMSQTIEQLRRERDKLRKLLEINQNRFDKLKAAFDKLQAKTEPTT